MIFPRNIFENIEKYLFTEDIVVLHGARQVGKTHILYYIENFLKDKEQKTYYIDLEDSRFVDILDAGVDEFVKHLNEEGILQSKSQKDKVFVLIDEIQYLENPSSFLKLIADHHKNIKLIVSGSSSFAIKSKFKDSLVGRTVNFEIFPLSFEEFLLFKKQSINSSLQKKLTDKAVNELKEWFEEFTLYGGYPKIVLTKSVELKEKYLQQIIDTYIRKDIKDLADIREIDKFNKLLEVLASQSGNLVEVLELANTCKLSRQTVENYLFILENTYIIKLVRPYYKNIRSELFKTAKVFFYDSGLMQMLWLKQLQKEVIGNVFETNIFAELVKQHGKENILYWRTADGKEIDFIVRIKNDLKAIEVKLNFERFDDTAIKYFRDKYESTYAVTALEGDMKNDHYKYPWEVIKTD
ncbi:ATP-binding protein [bacterium]|nr:MAG: ATP-binding protein [bacterium]